MGGRRKKRRKTGDEGKTLVEGAGASSSPPAGFA